MKSFFAVAALASLAVAGPLVERAATINANDYCPARFTPGQRIFPLQSATYTLDADTKANVFTCQYGQFRDDRTTCVYNAVDGKRVQRFGAYANDCGSHIKACGQTCAVAAPSAAPVKSSAVPPPASSSKRIIYSARPFPSSTPAAAPSTPAATHKDPAQVCPQPVRVGKTNFTLRKGYFDAARGAAGTYDCTYGAETVNRFACYYDAKSGKLVESTGRYKASCPGQITV